MLTSMLLAHIPHLHQPRKLIGHSYKISASRISLYFISLYMLAQRHGIKT